MSNANLEQTLKERNKTHGDFHRHAELAQTLKAEMRSSLRWRDLADDQRESLEMVAHKIGRILCGDPNNADSWHDIAGYAMLVDNRLTKPAPVEIKDGPYCVLCENLADFKGQSGLVYCSNCCANNNIDTSSMYTLGTL